jgi:adenylate kinase family enzyme
MTRSRRTLFGVVVQDAIKRVAVFGNAGGGKSTLARQLVEITRLPLYVLDKLQFREGGAAVPRDDYLELHRGLLARETWVIDGYGDDTTIWERLGAADALIHVDLTLPVHYWRVTKRLIKGLFADPEGWPRDSPLWTSTMYKTIPLCYRYMTPRYRRLVTEMAASKRVAHLRSPGEMAAFLDHVRNEFSVG